MIVTLTGATVKEQGQYKNILIEYVDTKSGEKRQKTIISTAEGYNWLVPIVERGEARGMSLDLKLAETTGKDGKKYWNVEGVKEAGSVAKPDVKTPNPYHKAERPSFTPSDDNKPRSMALSYAKDLACYGKIEVNDIEGWADYFLGYIRGSSGNPPEAPPEAPQSAGKPTEPPKDSEVLVEEAVELGGEIVPSAEEVYAKTKAIIAKDPSIKMGKFGNMMEELQSGVIEKSPKDTFGKHTFPLTYNCLTDENKIKVAEKIKNWGK